jgi:hypothetical protein
MQCTLLHKWLDRLPSELHTLKSFARIQVQEYGPLDLANGQERLTAVQMMCRLILGLGMATKLSVVEDQLPNDAQVSREEFIEGVFTGDEINSRNNRLRRRKDHESIAGKGIGITTHVLFLPHDTSNPP